MIETKLGKIQNIKFGSGGYDNAQFGISFTLGGEGWGVGDFRGEWSGEPSRNALWTKEDRQERFGGIMVWIMDLMATAKVNDITRLADIPVEVTFDGNTLKSWRILTEVL